MRTVEQDTAWSPSRDELAEIDRIAADPNAHVARLRQEHALRLQAISRTQASQRRYWSIVLPVATGAVGFTLGVIYGSLG